MKNPFSVYNPSASTAHWIITNPLHMLWYPTYHSPHIRFYTHSHAGLRKKDTLEKSWLSKYKNSHISDWHFTIVNRSINSVLHTHTNTHSLSHTHMWQFPSGNTFQENKTGLFRWTIVLSNKSLHNTALTILTWQKATNRETGILKQGSWREIFLS